jgi:heme a synthase
VYLNLIRITIILAFVVVVLGAYTRLSDAGLGCPDWPGCYGNIGVPETQEHIDLTNENYASRPLEQDKAWKEMIHRYAAGTLGLLILALAILAWKNRHADSWIILPVFLVVLVVFQALLGMWTVTLLLKPIIVMGHLLGGMTILLLLAWSYMKYRYHANRATVRKTPLHAWAGFGLAVVLIQISLGGWTSANYAALICPDFPVCQGQWWPPMDFRDGFIPWRGLGTNYEYGVLGPEARTAVHISHRIGAVLTLIIIGVLSAKSMLSADKRIRFTGIILLVVLLAQFGLGVANILLTLPVGIAVAHNAVAALLLLCVTALLFHTKYSSI